MYEFCNNVSLYAQFLISPAVTVLAFFSDSHINLNFRFQMGQIYCYCRMQQICYVFPEITPVIIQFFFLNTLIMTTFALVHVKIQTYQLEIAMEMLFLLLGPFHKH